MRKMSLDVVVPLYNDQEVIEDLCKTVFNVLEGQFKSVRLILILSFKYTMNEKIGIYSI